MENYEDKYEEYKNNLLQNRGLRNELHEKYQGSLRVEKDYLDENGVLWKTGILGAVCGFCIAFTPIKNGNWFLGIILFLAIMGSIILARHIGKKFKKASAERTFYAFRYHKHFEDHVNEERRRAMWELEQEFSKTVGFMQLCANNTSNDPHEELEKFRYALHYVEELEKKYKDISNYDYFVGKLKTDYQFNAEIQKDIDKYI